jgi:hypothetical protein
MTPITFFSKVQGKLRWWASKGEKKLYRHGLLPTDPLPLPDFLGIGAQKAGTTWLYENLRCHPDLSLADEKELHYFDWNFHESLTHYAQHFEQAEARVKGEITPGYSILPIERIRFIHSIMPEVKLIFLMRDPVERAWSQAVMNLVTLPERAYGEVPEQEFLDHFRAQRSMKRGDYLTILDNWLSVFPRDQLFIGAFASIAGAPRALLTEIFVHLGVSTDVNWRDFPYNEKVFSGGGVEIPPSLRAALVDLYSEDRKRTQERFGGIAKGWQDREEEKATC